MEGILHETRISVWTRRLGGGGLWRRLGLQIRDHQFGQRERAKNGGAVRRTVRRRTQVSDTSCDDDDNHGTVAAPGRGAASDPERGRGRRAGTADGEATNAGLQQSECAWRYARR